MRGTHLGHTHDGPGGAGIGQQGLPPPFPTRVSQGVFVSRSGRVSQLPTAQDKSIVVTMNTTNYTATDINQINNAVDSLLPFLPSGAVHVLAGLCVVLVPLMVIGRALLGFRQSGLWGAISGIMFGSNVPRPLQDCPIMSPKSPTKVPILLAVLALSLLVFGCAHLASDQVQTTTQGVSTNGIPWTQRTLTTHESAWTLLDAQDAIAKFRACQGSTNQSCGLTGLDASSTSTNLNQIISAVVTAAIAAAAN